MLCRVTACGLTAEIPLRAFPLLLLLLLLLLALALGLLLNRLSLVKLKEIVRQSRPRVRSLEGILVVC